MAAIPLPLSTLSLSITSTEEETHTGKVNPWMHQDRSFSLPFARNRSTLTSEVESFGGRERDFDEVRVLEVAIPAEVVHHGNLPPSVPLLQALLQSRLGPHFGPLRTRLRRVPSHHPGIHFSPPCRWTSLRGKSRVGAHGSLHKVAGNSVQFEIRRRRRRRMRRRDYGRTP